MSAITYSFPFFSKKTSLEEGYQIAFEQERKTALQPKDTLSNKAFERFKKLEMEIVDIAKKMGYHHPLLIGLTRKHSPSYHLSFGAESIYFGSFPSVLNISELFFLIEPEDLPKDLQLNGLNDPKMYDEEFLNKAVKWAYHFLGFKFSKHYSLNEQQRNNIQLFLKLVSNPILFQKSKRFILRHEISHLLLKHSEKRILEQSELTQAFWFSLSTGTGMYVLNQLFSWGLESNLWGIVLGVSTVALSHFACMLMHEKQKSQADEYTADAFAGKEEIESGIYYLTIKEKHELEFKNKMHEFLQNDQVDWIEKCFVRASSFLHSCFSTHPSTSSRIKNLKAV